MVTLAIVGVLAGIAWKGYEGYVVKQYRKSAIIKLLEVMQTMKKCKTDNASYEGGSCPADGDTYADQRNLYTITVSVPSGGASYSLTAARDDASRDPDCTALIIDDLGRKTATGALSSEPHKCWGD
jgi:type IV pilus assembly protein PilE